MLIAADYSASEREGVSQRLRIVDSSTELRAYTALRAAQRVQTIVDFAVQRTPDSDATVAADIVRALVAVATAVIDEWARTDTDTDLRTALTRRRSPLSRALGELLP